MTDPHHLVETLRAQAPALRAKGIAHLELFGSAARRQTDAGSDIDLLVELDDDAPLGLFDLVELKDELEQALGRPVDIAFRSRMRPWLLARIAPDLVRVF